MKRTVYRLVAGLIFLAVTFTQVGQAFLHGHYSLSGDTKTTLVDAPETPGMPCPVCSLNGFVSFYHEPPVILAEPLFASQSYSESVASGILIKDTDYSAGRAPPVC